MPASKIQDEHEVIRWIEEGRTYGWMVEEYRIQLFAQPMKTRIAVSPKRLSKIWDKMS